MILNQTDLAIVEALRSRRCATAREIAEFADVNRTSVYRRLNRLVTAGVVTRSEALDDAGRVIATFALPDGFKAVQASVVAVPVTSTVTVEPMDTVIFRACLLSLADPKLSKRAREAITSNKHFKVTEHE